MKLKLLITAITLAYYANAIPPEIVTQDIRLRLAKPDDLQTVLAFDAHPELGRFHGPLEASPEQVAQRAAQPEFITRRTQRLQENSPTNSYKIWLAYLKCAQTTIGQVIMHPVPAAAFDLPEDTLYTNIAICLLPEWSSVSYAYQIHNALLAHHFQHSTDATQKALIVQHNNQTDDDAMKVIQLSGYQHERRKQLAQDQHVDVYSLSRAAFEQSKKRD